ncbi:MAG: acetamidase/formamidase family protein [Candidatus Bathyarchaeia archaeon]
MVFHIFPRDEVHYKWDKSLEPVIRVSPEDTVVYELREVSDGQITPASTHEVIEEIDWNRVYPLSGPVYVEGAEVGDALQVEILDIHPRGWGWSAIIPGFGLLEDEFDEPKLKIWDLSQGDYTPFNEEVKIPLDPFCGTMGLAPPEAGEREVMPPGRHGGNMDNRHLTKGTVLLLPVWVEGGLLSIGDAHAAQGDGEVCVTGIECPMNVSLRIQVKKNAGIDAPQFTTPGPLTSKYDADGYHATMGIGPDLMEASRDAVRHMIDYISDRGGMKRWEAYILCSVVVDLKISEIVDKPNWVVTAYLPLRIFA